MYALTGRRHMEENKIAKKDFLVKPACEPRFTGLHNSF